MANRIYEMSIEELIDFLNKEAKFYAEFVVEKQEIPGDKYFNETRFDNDQIFDLFFGCDVMFNTPLGEESQDKLNNYVLEMFEPVQIEFRTRLGHPDPYGASTVMKL